MGITNTDFTSVTTGSPFVMNEGLVTVSGTFVGTVKLQHRAAHDADWVDVTDGEFTAAGSKKVNNGAGVEMRWNCTAFTSGTIECHGVTV